MSYFNQLFVNHKDEGSIDQEFERLYTQLNNAFVYSETRAPNTGDKGLVWFYRNGSQVDMYIFDKSNKTWRLRSFV